MTESKSFNRVATIILTFLVIVTLLPIVLLVIASFTKEQVLVQNGYTFFPKALSLDAYYYMVKQGAVIVRSYGVSFLVTILGTVMSVAVTTTLAYPMARKSFRYKNVLSFFVFFTMLFNGGIVPSYIMWSRFFHIKNTIWALIIPNYMVTAFNVILVKNFYQNNVPDALVEAAQIDGASELKTFHSPGSHQHRVGFQRLNVIHDLHQQQLDTEQLFVVHIVQAVRPVVPVAQAGKKADRRHHGPG